MDVTKTLGYIFEAHRVPQQQVWGASETLRLNCARAIVIATMACAFILATDEARAQARGSSVKARQDQVQADKAAARAAENTKLEAWLRRLVGQFQVTGDYRIAHWYGPPPCEAARRQNPNAIIMCRTEDPPLPTPLVLQGVGDCAGIGAGFGVHCMMKLAGMHEGVNKAPLLQLFPKMTLYGLDVNAQGIRFLQVDNHGIAEGALGELNGDIMIFKVQCPLVAKSSAQAVSCKREVRITAPPDGAIIRMWIQTDEHHRANGPTPVREGPQVFELQLQRMQVDEAVEGAFQRR